MGQKLNETYLNSLVEKIINETIHEKAEQIENMLMGKETDEGNAFTAALAKTKKGGKFKLGDKEFTDTSDYNEGELGEGESVCEQCGAKGPVMEGMCEQCSMNEGIYDVEAGVDFEENPSFDYVEEEEDMDVMDFEDDEMDSERGSEQFCEYAKDKLGENDPEYQKKCSHMRELARKPINMNEKLVGKQKNLDKNKNNKIDAEDFKMLRGESKERVKKSITMSESDLVSFIERIIKEELKTTTKHKGLATYEKAHTGSGKENNEYLKSVTKKMKEYLKDGSKGEYDTDPDIFPKGNGELAKMDKKAYIPSDAVQDYTDNLTAAGLENLDYDEIHPSEDWVSANIEGSSKTGNNPEWANTGKSDVNKKRNEIREKNLLGKIKRKAYNKAPQPIVQDTAGEDAGSKLMMKLESTDEKSQKKINEEFDRMKNLIGYNQKTQ
jgi:hypothetical protein